MSAFIHDDFMLQSQASKELYHNFAKDEPILDFHNHLPPDEIAANRSFETLYDIWLAGDHYKWRAMRANGIPEARITGDASPRDKFDAWAETVPPHTSQCAPPLDAPRIVPLLRFRRPFLHHNRG